MDDARVEQRRRYVQAVRNSFVESEGPNRRNSSRHQVVEQESYEGKSYWQIRCILSILLFAGFVYCDRTDQKIFDLTPDKIVKEIKESQFYDKQEDLKKQIDAFIANLSK